jgi:hypothetical protein
MKQRFAKFDLEENEFVGNLRSTDPFMDKDIALIQATNVQDSLVYKNLFSFLVLTEHDCIEPECHGSGRIGSQIAIRIAIKDFPGQASELRVM